MPDYTSYSDRELIVLMCHDNERAFTEIYHRYWKQMFVVAAKKSGDLQDAENIVQDIFLDLWKRRDELRIETELRAYLSVAVKYKVINVLAKKKRADEYRSALQHINRLADYSTEEWLSFEELKGRLGCLVAGLPEKCRLVYELSREHGYSQKQIARELNISEKTVESHLTRALKSIRKGISQYFLFYIVLVMAGLTWSVFL